MILEHLTIIWVANRAGLLTIVSGRTSNMAILCSSTYTIFSIVVLLSLKAALCDGSLININNVIIQDLCIYHTYIISTYVEK